MANFTVNPGVTDTGAKTVSNNDTGTIQAGGTLSDTTDITWTGGTAGPPVSTVTINNSGTITATTRGIDTSGSFSTGNFTFNNNSGAKLIASGNDAFRINTNITNGTITVNNSGLLVSGAVDANGKVIAHASGQALDFAAITSQSAIVNINNGVGATIGSSGDDAIRPGVGGHITIVNDGLIDATQSANRAININSGTTLNNLVSFELDNHAGATVQSQGDTVRITATTLSQTATYAVTLDNAGTIKSTGVGANNGQAIDFNDLTSPLGHVTITNEVGGLIQAADADAVRAGTNATVNNFGAIKGLNGTATSTGNDGIDFQASAPGGIVNNGDATHTAATIEGAAHGITGQQAITVNNWGTITGDLGSGINMDTPSLSMTTVTNHGTIIGTGGYGFDNGLPNQPKDGDGIDVDGLLTLDNFGTVQATGVHVVEADGSVDLQEAVTIGGGSITNELGGVITSFERAITVNDSDGTGGPNGSNGSNGGNGWAPTEITNWGLIHGGNGEAIAITDTFADTITNHGTIEGSVAMGGGDDIVNEYVGSSISGQVDGGDGTDTVNLLGTGTGTLSNVANVEILHVEGGNWTIADDETFSSGTTIDSGAALQVGNGSTAGSLTSDVADNGALIFDRSDAVMFSNTISGTGAVEQFGSGTTILSGHNSYSGGTEVVAGTLDVVMTDSAGTGDITLDAGAQVLRIEQTALSAGHFANTIDGFAGGGTIDLADNGVATSAALGAGNVLTVSGGANGPVMLQLAPGESFAGDVFKVVSDGNGGTDVTVAPDQAPISQNGTAAGDEDHVITDQVVASDPDSLPSPLTYSVVDGPQHGQLNFNADGSYAYTPDHDFNGADGFTFKTNDGILDSNTAAISLTINPVDDAPNFTSGANFVVPENNTAVGTIIAVDPEHDSFVFSVTGGDDASFFTVDAHTGALSFNNSPDFETPEDANHDNVYDVIVSATDVFGAANSQDINVKITDVAEVGKTINGGNGNDTLTGTTGNDTINGGNGNDHVDGGDGNDNLTGGNGNDVLIGGRGNNVMDGGNGDDVLTAADGNNVMSGGDGNDILTAGNGNNVMDGGNGSDRLTVGNGNNTMTGGNGNDVFIAGNGSNTMIGGNGNDVFTAGNGSNTMTGGNGNDVFTAGNGNNVMDGGNGSDRLTAGNGNNTMIGGNGNDVFTAGNGYNTITGGGGNEVFTVGNGDNTMSGGNGNDVFHVGSGNNVLSGGNGNDTFVFAANLGKDTVTDFTHADTIEFDGVFHDFQALMAASHQVGADTVIAVGAADSVTLEHVTLSSLHASDFHLV